MKSQEKDDFNLLNNMQEGLFLLDKNLGKIKFGSKTALRIMNYKQDVLAGCDMQKNVENYIIDHPNFLPVNILMHQLTGRTDDTPNMLDT